MGGEENISPRTEMVNRNFDVQMFAVFFSFPSGLIIFNHNYLPQKTAQMFPSRLKGSGTLSALVPVAEILCATHS